MVRRPQISYSVTTIEQWFAQQWLSRQLFCRKFLNSRIILVVISSVRLSQLRRARTLSLLIDQVLVNNHVLLKAALGTLLLHCRDVLVLEVNDTLAVAGLLHLLQVVRDRVEFVSLLGWHSVHYYFNSRWYNIYIQTKYIRINTQTRRTTLAWIIGWYNLLKYYNCGAKASGVSRAYLLRI